MKKLFIFTLLSFVCVLLAACDMTGLGDAATTTAPTTTADPAAVTTASAVTTTEPVLTTAPVTTLAPEEVLEEIKEPERFENVTIEMTGTVEGDAFDYDLLFNNSDCLMIDNLSDYSALYEGEEGEMVRSIFVDTALALLAHGESFTLTENGYLCEAAITYECDVLGAGHATITATNNLVTLDAGGNLASLSCDMVQSCEGEVLQVTVTFTFINYGTTVITPPAES